MKYLFTFLLIATVLTSKAQGVTCLVYHGCGGATVVANQGDLNWSSITYDFQRFLGGLWVTTFQSIENYHIVIPGDIIVATQYRSILRNNITGEERITNGVTVDPARFNNFVIKPQPSIIFHWGTPITNGLNYIEVLPRAGSIAQMRPPFTYQIKEKNSYVFDQKTSTTGIFFTNNITANKEYVITVTDFCGQLDSVSGVLSFAAFGLVTARNCNGASIQLSSVTNGQNLSYRQPITFGLAPLADSIPADNVPESILAGISYTYPAGISSGFTANRYVVRAQDAYGVLSNYTVFSTGLGLAAPHIISFGSSGTYCYRFATLSGNPFESGIRLAGSSAAYTFTTGATINNILSGYNYEIVTRDTCGRISPPLIQFFVANSPIINSINSTTEGCFNQITVNATSCTNTPEYQLKISGGALSPWQSSNFFEYQSITGCDTVYVRDGFSEVVSREVCVGILSGIIDANPSSGICGDLWEISVSNISYGVPPYQYAISYDGNNFTPFSSQSIFRGLTPGTYDVKLKDACGKIYRSTYDAERQVGDWYYVNEIGIKAACASNSEIAGGFIQFGIQQAENIYGTINTPYHYVLKEVTAVNGNNIQYGNVVYNGQTTDTTFTLSGLMPGKGYGIFITNTCGEKVTAKNRASNYFYIPVENLPLPEIVVNSSSCNQPFIVVNNLPTEVIIKIFKGRDTTGAVVNLSTPNTSTALTGGYYTIKVSTPNFNGCTWMQLYERYISTTDSTSAGTFDVNQGGICKADSSVIQLNKLVINQTPGGTWYGNIPDSIWINRDSGQFRTTGLADSIYQFEYFVQSLCGESQYLVFLLPINLHSCGLSGSVQDVISASSGEGCKDYAGDVWYDVLDGEGKLHFSINAGSGNTIESACWGARLFNSITNPRTITLNNTPVYIADRNFYIEPNQIAVGANPVRVRLYYSNYEIESLLTYLRNNGFPFAAASDLRILKKKAGSGSPVDLEVAVDAGAPMSLYSLIIPTTGRLGNEPAAIWYFEFEVNSFSELALVYTTLNGPLPVTWLYVQGQLLNTSSLIKWATSSESNTSEFEIEHSSNGIHYSRVGNLTAAGNSNATKRYEFLHHSPTAGKNYYRIKQIDLDGRFSFSSIIVLDVKKEMNNHINVYPNPAQNFIRITFNSTQQKTSLKLFNQNGQMVMQQILQAGVQLQDIDISKLAAGVYSAQVLTDKGVENFKFIKL